MPKHEKPDLPTLLGSLKSYYSVMHENMRAMDAMYHQDYSSVPLALPNNIKVYKSATPTLLVNDLRDQIRVDEPVVEAEAYGTSAAAKKKQGLQQMWGADAMASLSQEGIMNAFSQARFDLFLRGAAVVKRGIKKEVLQVPERRESESSRSFKERKQATDETVKGMYPFWARAIDPLNFFPSPGPGPLKYAIEVQSRRVLDMWEGYPLWSDPKARDSKHPMLKKDQLNPLRAVEWVEYWSWIFDASEGEWTGHYLVEVDNEEIIHEANSSLVNPYGQVPYTFRYGGLGRTNENADPSAMSTTILEQIAGEIEAEVITKTAWNAAWQFHVFPRAIGTGSVEKEQLQQALQVGPGGVMVIPAGSEVRWMEQPPPNQTMMGFLEKIEGNIQRMVNPALSGQRTGESGIHQALQTGQALKITGPILQNLDVMASQTLNGLAELLVRFDIKMNVHGGTADAEEMRMVGPKVFDKHKITATFEAVDPSEDERKMLSMLAVVRDHKILSRETYRKISLKGIVQDNEEEEGRVMSERLLDQMIDAGVLGPLVMQQLQLQQQEAQQASATPQIGQQLQGALQQAGQRAAGQGAAIEELVSPGITEPGQIAAEEGARASEI